MTWRSKTAILSIVVVANLAILWWRYQHEQVEINGVGPFVAALGAAQANTVIAWRSAPSVPLTRDAISEFVERMKWGDCATSTAKATTVSRETLTQGQQESLCRTIVGLITAYSQGEPEQLYDLMTNIDGELSSSSVASLQRLLVADGKKSAKSEASLSPRDLFLSIARRIHYGAHWQALVSESACVGVWRSKVGQEHLLEEIPLGESMAGLFKNQTRYNHLFQRVINRQEVSATETTFADVQFVVKHDRQLMFEPSAYHIRLVFDPGTATWHPVEMIHVATISGNSPVLLF